MGSGSCDSAHGLISCPLLLQSHGKAGSGSRSSCRKAGGLLAVIAPHNASESRWRFLQSFGGISIYWITAWLIPLPKSQFPLRIINLRSNFANLIQVSLMSFKKNFLSFFFNTVPSVMTPLIPWDVAFHPEAAVSLLKADSFLCLFYLRLNEYEIWKGVKENMSYSGEANDVT